MFCTTYPPLPPPPGHIEITVVSTTINLLKTSTYEDHPSPTDFLAAFQYENRNLEYIDPSISKMRELDVHEDCCPVVLLPYRREDCERLIDGLNRLAGEYSATIFLFISNAWEFLYEAQKSFTSIVTFDKSDNGGTVVKGAGAMHEGPYTIDQPPVAIVDTPREAHAEDPAPKPTETVTKISDLVKTCGFHQTRVSVFNADALIRGDKTDFVCCNSHNVQKGDWLVLSTDSSTSHAINGIVWEVSFVSNIPFSRSDNGYSHVALSIRRIPNARFEKGDIAGPYFEDCIVTTTP